MERIINLDNLLIGSDPEFFLKKDGEIKTSLDYIAGDKYSPINIGKYKVFKDNVLVEGNMLPSTSSNDFINKMKEMKEMIKLVSGGCDVISMDSFKFKPEQLDNEEAKTFGCSPYELGWESKTIDANDLSKSLIRSAGFHIHIGYEKESNKIMKKQLDKMIARAYDYFCINPSRIHHNDEFRNKNYGVYGAYRNKPYGVEVRSLGGFFSQDKYLEWVYNQSIETIKFVSNPENFRKLQMLKSPKFTNAEYRFLNINLTKQLI